MRSLGTPRSKCTPWEPEHPLRGGVVRSGGERLSTGARRRRPLDSRRGVGIMISTGAGIRGAPAWGGPKATGISEGATLSGWSSAP